ncbi:hypothetical protein QN362_04785 [Actimicrobium sp. CCC2.4]|uniref:hypothetical protein n=1 Tax=Actimicrobium sp. CCC2.4 TaxID=3048606 RepID=UPI002AC8C35A|nr:hypothetical protein [Actimicrobium sp. CCC2.4]MEB0134641.1 hypothetical protein [Actimicrobium sp. CCC2.4]WPX30585.1 hypothetical protein RHM62_09870 [Actimicrobium sp. CCC2.4]
MERKSVVLAQLADRRTGAENRTEGALKRRKAAELSWSKIGKVFQGWQVALNGGVDGMLDVSLDSLNDQLDIALRAPIFGITDRYWSGRWLLEMKDRLKTGEADS